MVHDIVYPRARADNGIVAVEVVERSVETVAAFSAQCEVACGPGKYVGVWLYHRALHYYSYYDRALELYRYR